MRRSVGLEDDHCAVDPVDGRSGARLRPGRSAVGSNPRGAAQDADRVDPRAFVVEHATRQRPPLVPEVELWLGGEVIELWERTEAWVGQECGPPFWAFPWAGGQALARVVLDRPDIVRGRRVVDFGAGSGLVAIAAALAGARRVVAVDIDPLALTACELNAEANGVQIDLSAQDVVGSRLDDVDVVLAGDMFYERGASARFWQWLCQLPKQGTPVYLGDPGRNYLPEGLELQASFEVPTSRDLEGRDGWTARVWRVPG